MAQAATGRETRGSRTRIRARTGEELAAAQEDIWAESRVQRKRTRRQTAALVALLSVGTASAVSAQASPSGTQELEEVVTRGMTVWITDSTGREQKARILDMSDDTVTATADEGVRRLPIRDVLRIRARRPTH